MGNKEFKSIAAGSIMELLKPLGYKKSGFIFTKDIGELVFMIGLQSSTTSTSKEPKVTLNVGIWIKILSDNKKASIWECQWRSRIGKLMPENSDKWWSMASIEDAVKVSIEIRDSINDYALPILQSLNTLEKITEQWKTGKSPGLTVKQRDSYLQELIKC